MTEENDTPKRGLIGRVWNGFWSPVAAFSVGFIVIAGFLGGIMFWGAFNWAMELTNTEEFCVSCHTMETNLGEYRETVHYNNHSGVRAICSDCHVPHEWQYKVKAKIIAVKDVYHEIMGTISTPEKYEEHRLKMAALVWRKMKASDSRECRNCHSFEYMDFTIQETRAADAHQRAIDETMTCIDCHQGIAHKLAPGYQEEYKRIVDELQAEAAPSSTKTKDVAEIRSYVAGLSGK
ncbi:NapC/NirT family cytochrome c [Roseibium sp.]|uniref:NapC/NirT family cytochrome c n=1 Tax=Roseibium sp. TaxID=1936156 RepID=UPI003D12F3CF